MGIRYSTFLVLLTIFCPLIARISLETVVEIVGYDPFYEKKITTTSLLEDYQQSTLYESDDFRIEAELITAINAEIKGLVFVSYSVSTKKGADEWEVLTKRVLITTLGKMATITQGTKKADGSNLGKITITLLATETQ